MAAIGPRTRSQSGFFCPRSSSLLIAERTAGVDPKLIQIALDGVDKPVTHR